jgi:hypothetical protein
VASATIRKIFSYEGSPTDMTGTVYLADSTGTYGVKDAVSGAVIVAANTAMTKEATGTYAYTFTAPAGTYTYGVKYVYQGATAYIPGTIIIPGAAGATYTMGAVEVYNHVIQVLGAVGVSSPKQTAVQVAVQAGLNFLWNYWPWSWRIRQVDIAFSNGINYFDLPTDYESISCPEICRTSPTDNVTRTLIPRGDRDFWRIAGNTNISGIPLFYRVVARPASSMSHPYSLEVAPIPDGTYQWPKVEYCVGVPTLEFTGATGTVPEMPPEFYAAWCEAAAWQASKALGRHKLARQLKVEMDETLSDAAKRYDTTFQGGSPQGVEDPYRDAWRLL